MAAERGRCEDHKREAWANRASSTERYGLSGSAQQALHRSVLIEAGFICYDCGLPGADVVDHIIPIHLGGARTDRSNLGAMHQDPCHDDKTKAENAERARVRAAKRAATIVVHESPRHGPSTPLSHRPLPAIRP
jgi:5-methylcytosine-specific restriction endonuclease McrA